MRSDDLTHEQLQKMEAALHPALRYLNKLLRRMQFKGFDHEDPLWLATVQSQRTMLKLMTELRCNRVRKQATPPAPKSINYTPGYRLGRPVKDTH